MKRLLCWMIFLLPLCAEEATVYQYRDAEFEWVWKLNPGRLTTGMQSELVIEARVLDGIKVNLSSELKEGDFRLHDVNYLPMRWEKPYWVHEMRALLSVRLPGEYRLPQHTVYLQNGQTARTVTSEARNIQVHGLIGKKVMEKEELKPVEFLEEKQPISSALPLGVLTALAALCVWQLYQSFSIKSVVVEEDNLSSKGMDYWKTLLSKNVNLNERQFQELYVELEAQLEHSSDLELQRELKQRWTELRYDKKRTSEEWLSFLQSCSMLERAEI